MIARIIQLIFILSVTTLASDAQRTSIIPKPKQLVEKAGSFTLDDRVSVYYSSQQLKTIANYAVSAIQEISRRQLSIKTGSLQTEKTIRLSIDPAIKTSPEGYLLEVKPSQISITANAEQGLFYGVQTLLQLMPVDKGNQIPCVQIEDEPRFSWRGMLFDNCRHMFSVDFIKKFIDQLAYHKLNKFHWHLAEDRYPYQNQVLFVLLCSTLMAGRVQQITFPGNPKRKLKILNQFEIWSMHKT